MESLQKSKLIKKISTNIKNTNIKNKKLITSVLK